MFDEKIGSKTRNVAMIIMACCVLHNVCEIHGEEIDDTWLEDNKNHLTLNPIMKVLQVQHKKTIPEAIR